MKRNPLNPVSRTSPQLDWITTVVPFITILLLCILFFAVPEASGRVVASIRYFLGDEFGSCYLLMGLGIFLCSLYIAFSPYGAICLGADKKPQYSSFQWGSMMFTAGLAADILFYSLCEWILYAGEPRISQMEKCRTGLPPTPCFTGGLSPGVSTWCWPWHSALCSMYGKGRSRNTPRPAVLSLAFGWTVLRENLLT